MDLMYGEHVEEQTQFLFADRPVQYPDQDHNQMDAFYDNPYRIVQFCSVPSMAGPRIGWRWLRTSPRVMCIVHEMKGTCGGTKEICFKRVHQLDLLPRLLFTSPQPHQYTR